MSDTPTTAEEMREAAAMLAKVQWIVWQTQGAECLVDCDATACEDIATAIRALPCAPDPRLAALEAERDRLRLALRRIADTPLSTYTVSAAIAMGLEAQRALEGGRDG